MAALPETVEAARRRYRRFIEHEAGGVSPLYEAFAAAVCGDVPTLELLADLPVAKQQPNLLFAAVRHLFGTPEDGEDLLTRVATEADAVRDLMLRRSVQLASRRAPTFPCDASAATPRPAEVPEVVWRLGIDLAPVDIQDPGEAAWLETLVWPEQQERAERLRKAIAIARATSPRFAPGIFWTHSTTS